MYILVSAFLILGAFLIAGTATASATPISPWLAHIGDVPRTAAPLPGMPVISPSLR